MDDRVNKYLLDIHSAIEEIEVATSTRPKGSKSFVMISYSGNLWKETSR